MKSPARIFSPRTWPGLTAWLLAGVFCLFACSLCAATNYLAVGHPDGIALLAPPPIPGSEEEAADLAAARSIFKNRTPAEESRALKDASLSFSIFASAIGPNFALTNFPKSNALLQQVKKEVGEIIDIPKNHWKRLRPYQMDPELSLGAPERSFAYPSGHSTRGTVYALVLAELFPDKKEAILTIGREIGWDRIIIGKHFPTDVHGGRVLGKAIMRDLMASATFQHDLAEAQAEVRQSPP